MGSSMFSERVHAGLGGGSIFRSCSLSGRGRLSSTMTKSSRLFLFPDINVWVALTYDRLCTTLWRVGGLKASRVPRVSSFVGSHKLGCFDS